MCMFEIALMCCDVLADAVCFQESTPMTAGPFRSSLRVVLDVG
jgi:hypothetical protein